MVDKCKLAGEAGEVLDEQQRFLEDLRARVETLEASGEMTPEMEAQVAALMDQLRLFNLLLRESVDPTIAPLLRIKRLVKEGVRKAVASGMAEVEVRSAFGKVVEQASCAFPEEVRPQIGPLVDAAIDEVLLEVPSGSGYDNHRNRKSG